MDASPTAGPGLTRAIELLAPEAARLADAAGQADGYLDLLGGDLESTGAAQDLMTTSLVPSIYERYWRPALARAVKGVTGPGMGEEVRIARLLFANPFASLDEMRRVLAPGGRIALMTSVRRSLTVPPLKPVIERASGMRLFEADELVLALQHRGFGNVRQRLAGMVQFLGGRLAAPKGEEVPGQRPR